MVDLFCHAPLCRICGLGKVDQVAQAARFRGAAHGHGFSQCRAEVVEIAAQRPSERPGKLCLALFEHVFRLVLLFAVLRVDQWHVGAAHGKAQHLVPLRFERTDFTADKALRRLRIGVQNIGDLQSLFPATGLRDAISGMDA